MQNLTIGFFSNMPDENTISRILTSYTLSPLQLREIAESSNYEKIIRASALALFWLFQHKTESRLDLKFERNLYAELVEKINESWLSSSLIIGVLIRYSETDSDALSFVIYLMERCHDGDGPYKELIYLLGNWREKSIAPVFSKNVLQKWLGCECHAPIYAN